MLKTINQKELSIQLNETKNMKYILNIQNQDISYEDLKMKIDSLCKHNLIHFIVLRNYLSEMPEEVKQTIGRLKSALLATFSLVQIILIFLPLMN